MESPTPAVSVDEDDPSTKSVKELSGIFGSRSAKAAERSSNFMPWLTSKTKPGAAAGVAAGGGVAGGGGGVETPGSSPAKQAVQQEGVVTGMVEEAAAKPAEAATAAAAAAEEVSGTEEAAEVAKRVEAVASDGGLLQEKLRKAEEELEQTNYELAALKARHMEKTTALKTADEARVMQEHKIKVLQNTLAQAQKQIQKFEDERQVHLDNSLTEDEHAQRLKDAMDEVQREKIQPLEEQVRSIKDTLVLTSSNLDQLEAAHKGVCKSLEEERVKGEGLTRQLAESVEEKEGFKRQAEALRQALGEAEKRVGEVSGKLEAAEAEGVAKDEELKKVQEEVAQLQQVLEEERTKGNEVEKELGLVKASLEERSSQLQKVTEGKEAVECEVVEVKKQVDDALRKLSDTEEALKASSAEVEEKRGELERTQAEFGVLKEAHEVMSRKLESISLAHDKKAEALDALRCALENATREVEELQIQNKAKQADYAELKAVHGTLKEEHEGLRKELEDVQGLHGRSLIDLEEERNGHAATAKVLEETSELKSGLEVEVMQLQQQKEEVEAKVSELEAEMKAKLEAAEGERSALEEELRRVRFGFEGANEELSEVKKVREALASELLSLKSYLEGREKEVKEAEQRFGVEVEGLKEGHGSELRMMAEEHGAQLRGLQEESRAEVERVREEGRAEVEKLREEMRAQLEGLRQEHGGEQEKVCAEMKVVEEERAELGRQLAAVLIEKEGVKEALAASQEELETVRALHKTASDEAEALKEKYVPKPRMTMAAKGRSTSTSRLTRSSSTPPVRPVLGSNKSSPNKPGSDRSPSSAVIKGPTPSLTRTLSGKSLSGSSGLRGSVESRVGAGGTAAARPTLTSVAARLKPGETTKRPLTKAASLKSVASKEPAAAAVAAGVPSKGGVEAAGRVKRESNENVGENKASPPLGGSKYTKVESRVGSYRNTGGVLQKSSIPPRSKAPLSPSDRS